MVQPEYRNSHACIALRKLQPQSSGSAPEVPGPGIPQILASCLGHVNERKMKRGMIAFAAPAPIDPPVASRTTGPTASQPSGAIRSVLLPGPVGHLEAILNEGASDAPFAALVCHPHPVFGGTMHNKVVYHAMKVLNDPQWGFSWPVLRFNFRGAGLSEGVHDGAAEADDVLAAMDWLEREFARPIIATGFSFGAAMALAACCRSRQTHDGEKRVPELHALIALGLPIQVDRRTYNYSFLQETNIPKLFLSGDGDPFASPDQLAQIVASAAEPKQLTLIPGADHFFSGLLGPMQRAMAGWLGEQQR
jgi:uncharacterized protein